MDNAPSEDAMNMTDDQWLGLVKGELAQSIGFTHNGTVEGEREAALKAYTGDVGIAHVDGRSKVQDTALRDAVHTLMPDLMDIFTGGEDVATFEPVGPEDVEAARQETDAVVSIAMEENDGFNVIHDYCWNALVLKTGILKVWQDETSERVVEHVAVPEGADGQGFANMVQGQLGDEAEGVSFDPEAGRVEITRRLTRKRRRWGCIPSEDFAVANDTDALSDTTYCVQRTKMRAQDLIAQGHDRDAVMRMSLDAEDEAVSDARDTVEDDDDFGGGGAVAGGLRFVTLYEHYVRLAGDDGVYRIWQVMTDGACQVFLGAEEVDVIPFAGSSPYRRPHRFHGDSLADLIMEVQKIKTSLWRLFLDSGYFAINQRSEIDAKKLHPDTLTRWAANKPGDLIPTMGGNAISPIGGAGLSFDVISAMEAVSVLSEERTGVVRNAQGLNPDTLHDTARGAQILMGAAQKRTRQIARNLAQGLKDAFLLIHRFARADGEQITLRRRGEFIPIDPSAWGFRQDATIRVGVGSGGRDAKLAAIAQVIDYQAQVIEMQGGANGPLVTLENLHNTAVDFAKAAGIDDERYFADPKDAPPPQEPAGPSPEEQEAQAKMAAQAAQHQQDMAIAKQKADLEMEIERFKADSEAQLAQQKAAAEVRLAEMKAKLEATMRPRIDLPDNRPGGSLAA